jgi:ABC-type uncharacterized transport system ATPase subunit
MEYAVEMLHIRKQFSGFLANDDIMFNLRKGEVHALLGENGAGKSTLMGILFGLIQPDQGTIKINGKIAKISNPNIANDLGIGMVHQHFKLVSNFTITENIILGLEPHHMYVLNLKNASNRIKQLSLKYGLNVDPNAKIEDISVGMQQRVEILKMLYRNADILIFDEPTAVLTPQEIKEFIQILKNLIAEGKSIILITHKLKEIKAIADRCTVIRRGKWIGTIEIKSTSEITMAEMMVGRSVNLKVDKPDITPGDLIFNMNSVSVRNNKKLLGLKNFSLDIHKGEIIGIAGVEGNGQAEIVESITGLRHVESGYIFLNNQNITNHSIRDRIKLGIAHIPEDRQKRGLILDYSIEDNLILKNYHQRPFSRNGLLNRQQIQKHAMKIIEKFDVRLGHGNKTFARSLSGGNQQKAIIGREFEQNPQLIIAVQPTRGLDVGSIEYIHKRLIEHRNQGNAVLLISLELDEIVNLSDRIVVVSNGECIGVIKNDHVNENEIGLLMAGVKKGDRA